VQTGNVIQAESLFNSVTNSNIPIIGAMMKGKITILFSTLINSYFHVIKVILLIMNP